MLITNNELILTVDARTLKEMQNTGNSKLTLEYHSDPFSK